jgi:hypothetical protein
MRLCSTSRCGRRGQQPQDKHRVRESHFQIGAAWCRRTAHLSPICLYSPEDRARVYCHALQFKQFARKLQSKCKDEVQIKIILSL